jgi:hypothetical protein
MTPLLARIVATYAVAVRALAPDWNGRTANLLTSYKAARLDLPVR